MPDEMKATVRFQTMTEHGALAYADEHCANGSSPLPTECRFALSTLAGRLRQLVRGEEDAWGLVNKKSDAITVELRRIELLEAGITSAIRLIVTEKPNEAIAVLSGAKRSARELLPAGLRCFEELLQKLGANATERTNNELLRMAVASLATSLRPHLACLPDAAVTELLPAVELCEALVVAIEARS